MNTHAQVMAIAKLNATRPSCLDHENLALQPVKGGILIDVSSWESHAMKVKSIMQKFAQPFGKATPECLDVALQDGVIVSEQKPLLWKHSEYFRAIDRFRTTGQDRVPVPLEDFTADNWAVFATWLRDLGDLEMFKLVEGRAVSENSGSNDFWADEMTRLASAWLFGEYICAPAFQNDLMECLVNLYYGYIRHHSQIPAKHMQLIANKTFEGSKLWGLLQDVIQRAYNIGHLTLTNEVEDLLEDLDLTYILEELRKGQYASHLMDKNMNHKRLYCFYRVHRRGQDTFRYHKNRDAI